MKIKNFVLIIGAMKCGTTSLFNYLAEHPQIAACKEKEPSFFSGAKNYNQGLAYYQDLWDWEPERHKIAMEASTSYTRVTNPIYVNAADNIKQLQEQLGCQFKFIYVMRNPLDRIESHYTHAAAWKSKELRVNIAGKSNSFHSEAVDVSKYAMQLDEYYKNFDANNIFLINFDNLKLQPAKLLENICKFLEIDSSYKFKQLDAVYNQNQGKTRIQLPGWYSIRHTPIMKLVNKKTPDNIRQIFYRLFKRQVRNEYIRLSLAQKQAILDELKTDLKVLDTQYKFDIRQWNLDNLN